ncbi:hypothetical protein GZL_00235 [Streptomyces sp. 769]|nr:hypothetical protein GZL_00235 [Streptomyces sp. 769]
MAMAAFERDRGQCAQCAGCGRGGPDLRLDHTRVTARERASPAEGTSTPIRVRQARRRFDESVTGGSGLTSPQDAERCHRAR